MLLLIILSVQDIPIAALAELDEEAMGGTTQVLADL
jgi:hypothetical protein